MDRGEQGQVDMRKFDRREFLETGTKIIGAMSVFSIAIFRGADRSLAAENATTLTDGYGGGQSSGKDADQGAMYLLLDND